MKTILRIIFFINLFLLIISCQKKKENIASENRVKILLKNYDLSSSIGNYKEKTLDTVSLYLLKHKNDSINRNLLFKVANKYYELNKYNKYLKLTLKVKEFALKQKDTFHMAKSLYFLGEYYEDKAQLDSSFSYYSQSEKLYRNVKDTLNSGRTALYKAGILFDSGNFTESEIGAINALKFLSKTNNTRLVYESYTLLALSLKELNNFEESLKYFDLALNQLQRLEKEDYPKDKLLKSRISCFNNIGRVYEKQKNYKQAILFYEKGLALQDLKLNYPKSYAMLLDNMAYSKMKEGDFKDIDKLLFESLKISDSMDIAQGIVSSKINIGEYYLYKNDTIKGLSYITEGFKLAKKIEAGPFIIRSLKLLTENDSKNKSYYSNLYVKVNDSIQNVERITRNKFARIAYETDQIEEKNEILSQKNTNIILGSGIIIIFLGVFFALYRLQSKNKELQFIKEQQEANEKIYQLMLAQQSETEHARNEERNRIAMELHDGIINSVFTTRFNLIQLESNSPSKKQELINELEKTEQEIRRVSHDLTQNLLFEDKSLPEILNSLVDSQQNKYNTKFDLSVDKYIDWSVITGANKIHIYRIIQEAIQNSNKYSEAERCFIMLLKTGDKITIRIWDNGIGFNTEKVRHGIGLKNIKDRAKILKGELKLNSSPENGTTIEIVF
ncbi:tetratricopeptide repeat protein [Flavobacterium sp. GT3P67]|uniref:ATP-binding protein n=1 Tax=Flavobacterium sp. GT3P67 TaxID=2541722 RepID=UPI00105128EE|nr:sensor histidine kinase [Flavobacterium sp. GT3P67]TDE52711.1 tetratricopeptide repeat protein [Flavobacterium sp. GT3P67]